MNRYVKKALTYFVVFFVGYLILSVIWQFLSVETRLRIFMYAAILFAILLGLRMKKLDNTVYVRQG